MFLTVLAWVACVVVVFGENAKRAADQGGDHHFQQGYTVGGLVTCFALATLVWWIVQHRIRKREGWPPWIGLIAVALGFVLSVSEAGAGIAPCTPIAQAYGTPPAGWSFAPADAQTRDQVRKQLGDDRVDVRLANRGATHVALLGVPNVGRSYLDDAESGAREIGATVGHTSYGATTLTYPKQTYAVYGRKGCNVIGAVGQDAVSVDTVARAIFR